MSTSVRSLRSQHSILSSGRFPLTRCIPIAVLVLLLFSPTDGSAQSNGSYNFRQQSVNDGDRVSTEDDAAVLTMNCLTANGYGQWTLSNGTSPLPGSQFGTGWYLLANGLYKPSQRFVTGDPTHPGCIPPGVVQNGALAGGFPSEPKATANLDGSTNYVWPESVNRTTFVAQGFGQPDISIALASGFPNSAGSRQVVKNAIHAFPPIQTWTGAPANTHDVVVEADYRDEFDVSSDAHYLYIVWASTVHPVHGGMKEIWVTAIDLLSMAPAPGFPLFVDDGERPTIACDPRNNRTGAPTPTFQISYLTGHSVASSVKHALWNGTALMITPLANLFQFPDCATQIMYSFVTHARVLVSSVPGQAPTAVVYAIIDRDGLTLVEYKQILPGMAATYVDGAMLTPASPLPASSTVGPLYGWPVIDNPIAALANPYDQQNFPTASFDQFHCLYQLNVTPTHPAGPPRSPLLIVQGSDNGSCTTSDSRLVVNQVYSPGITPPPPPMLLPDDPTSYVAAVNQMGIHVHWRTATNIHFYSRDLNRTFDEDIDENTLVTDQCSVTDGSAHGGSAGTTILQQKRMTVWTDPNYGFSTTDVTSGLYQPRDLTVHDAHAGQLTFVGDNVKLYVGGASEWVTGVPGTLTVMPFFYFNFDAWATGQGVEVHGVWDYYGLNATHDNTGARTGIASPFTWDRTFAYMSYPYTIDIEQWIFHPGPGDPALNSSLLRVHGGADFYTATSYIGAYGDFLVGAGTTSVAGAVDVLYEPSLYPRTTGTANPSSTGHLTLRGKTTLTSSTMGGTMTGHIPANSSDIIMTVDNGFGGWVSGSATTQFYENNFYFSNTPTTGTSELLFGHANCSNSSPRFWKSTFEGGTCSATKIHAIDPLYDILIENVTFDRYNASLDPDGFHPDQSGYAIWIENDKNPITAAYGPITIHNNTFQTWTRRTGSGFYSYYIYGIYIKNFDGPANPPSTEDHNYATVTVSGNTFTHTNSWTYNEDVSSAAITLENTTANVLSNTITDGAFSVGIHAVGSQYGSDPIRPTYSLICSNSVSHPYNYCMENDHLYGYVKLNTLGPSTFIDYQVEGVGSPRLIFNSISGYGFFGIRIDDQGVADMSGVHGSTSAGDDYAAYNSVHGLVDNGTCAQGHWSPIHLDGSTSSVALGNSLATWAWTQYGENNIFVDYPSGEYFGKITSRDATINIGNIDRNFWGAGVDPGGHTACPCNWKSTDALEVDAESIQFTAATAQTRTSASTFSGVSCGAGTGYISHEGKGSGTSQAIDSVATGCQLLYNLGYAYSTEFKWQMCYDTLKKFIETCPHSPESWRGFSLMYNATNALYSSDTAVFTRFREWLTSVLYLNTTDPQYFCACVEAFPLGSPKDTNVAVLSKETNKQLALIRWLLLNTSCDTAMLRREYTQGRISQWNTWHSDSAAGNYFVLDTTLPSMRDLGLDTTLARHFQFAGTKPFEDRFASVMPEFSVSKNPFSKETVLRFHLKESAYVNMSVYDLTGRPIVGDGSGHVYDAGEHAWPVDLGFASAGTYYLRIMLGTGEVRTLKLVKE